MSSVLYEYAKDENNKFVNIKYADKSKFYYLESELNGKVQMIPVQGQVLQWHFRSKVQGEAIRMTAQHINLQAKICNDLQFYCKGLDLHVYAKKSIPEYRLSNNRIVDVAYFDDNDDFLCGIEVVHTNDINYEKFKDLYNSDYFIFKVYTNAPERFIFIGNEKVIRESKQRLHETYGTEITTYKRNWNIQMEEYNISFAKEANRLREICNTLSKESGIQITEIENEYNDIIKEETAIDELLCKMQSRHNIGGSYFDTLRQVKFKLREIETEESQLIRDIEEITEQINNLI